MQTYLDELVLISLALISFCKDSYIEQLLLSIFILLITRASKLFPNCHSFADLETFSRFFGELKFEHCF